jgi:acetoin utilization deacetylase AcuC-like enzyme
MKLVFAKSCLHYRQDGHPESPERVRKAWAHLEPLFDTVEPDPASENDLLAVHTERHVVSVRSGEFYDWDTPNLPGIYEHARLSAGGAIAAMNSSLDRESAMSLMRPPGHHAGPDYLAGFCYFNNIAVAVARGLERVDRVAIIDFDCHHGNGTQDIFLGHERVMYLSFHQSPFYPGTGLTSDQNCFNFPMGSGTDDRMWLSAFDQGLKGIRAFKPDLIAVSAGFDGYRRDPFAIFSLSKDLFETVGQRIADLGKPVFTVLEGGYSGEVGACAERYLRGLRGSVG